jgi:hypothetical protein
MKQLLLALLFAGLVPAQTTVTLTGPVNTRPGATVVLSVQLGGVTAPGPAGLQWTVIFPPSPWTATVTPGAAAQAASKDILVCTADNSTCVLIGYNVTSMDNGSVAQYTLTGTGACRNDQNGDGRCDLRDVFAVLLKALGK